MALLKPRSARPPRPPRPPRLASPVRSPRSPAARPDLAAALLPCLHAAAVAALALLAAVLPPAAAAAAPPPQPFLSAQSSPPSLSSQSPSPPPPSPPPASLEYKVKAAFLFNFAKFVTWPPETFRDPRDPLALCVFGADPFGGDLDAIVAGERLDTRPIEVRRVNRLDDLRSCQIAFFSRGETGRLPEILASLRGSNVLTVGESKRFAEQGGLIRFVLDGKRVRFEVNLDALERTRLTVSSKLLRVAQVVRPDTRGAPH